MTEPTKPTGAPDAALVAKCGCPMFVRNVGEDPITLHTMTCEKGFQELQASRARASRTSAAKPWID